MISLASIITYTKADLLAQQGDTLLPRQLQSLADLEHCRSAVSKHLQAACSACDTQVLIPHSCGNRLCPTCQSHESQRWIERQRQLQVKASYFMVTFTLPAELRRLAFAHQRVVYQALMQTSWETVRTFSLNDKKLQGTPGAVAVLHTHTRRLDYHPHVHLVMPAGAIDLKHRQWRQKQGKAPYLFSHKAMAKVFRAKLLDALATAGLPLPERIPRRWVVHCKPVGSGAKAIVYLGRYLYRGVIREKDILAFDNGEVTFQYRDGKSRQLKRRTLPAVAFLRLILSHVLPKGFRRARNFGYLHPNSKRLLQLLQLLQKVIVSSSPPSPRPALRCPCCQAPMTFVRTQIPASRASSPPRSTSAQGVHAM